MYDKFTYDVTHSAQRTEGTPGTPAVTSVSVATSSTSLLAANANRRGLMFSNTSANPIYVNLAGGTAVATNLLIPAGGAPVIINNLCPTNAITAIAGTGASNLSVTELT